MKKTTILVILIIIILLIGLIVAIYLAKRKTFQKSEASSMQITKTNIVRNDDVTLENSYIFASPVKARINGEIIRVTIFLLDSQGKGVPGMDVEIGNNESLKVTPVNPVTDEYGKAIYDIVGYKPGSYTIEARTDGKTIPQRVEVLFE